MTCRCRATAVQLHWRNQVVESWHGLRIAGSRYQVLLHRTAPYVGARWPNTVARVYPWHGTPSRMPARLEVQGGHIVAP